MKPTPISHGGSPHPVDIHVGKQIRTRRTILGISQEKLGELLGISFQQVQKYERGVNRVGASRLFEISEALNVQVGFFFEGYGDKVRTGPVSPDILNTRETLELVRAYHAVDDPYIKRTVVELLRRVVDAQTVMENA